jgi:nucleotide-binding universal stress UspA family protein
MLTLLAGVMSESAYSPHMRALIVFDASAESEAALDWATELDGCEATVLGVHPPPPKGRGYRGRPDPEPIGYASREQLEQAVNRLSLAGVSATLVEKEGTLGPDPVLEVAREGAFDLIVIPIHPKSRLKRFLFGSKAESVARDASAPVLLVRLPSKHGEA